MKPSAHLHHGYCNSFIASATAQTGAPPRPPKAQLKGITHTNFNGMSASPTSRKQPDVKYYLVGSATKDMEKPEWSPARTHGVQGLNQS
jgi:hypothetical protein